MAYKVIGFDESRKMDLPNLTLSICSFRLVFFFNTKYFRHSKKLTFFCVLFFFIFGVAIAFDSVCNFFSLATVALVAVDVTIIALSFLCYFVISEWSSFGCSVHIHIFPLSIFWYCQISFFQHMGKKHHHIQSPHFV